MKAPRSNFKSAKNYKPIKNVKIDYGNIDARESRNCLAIKYDIDKICTSFQIISLLLYYLKCFVDNNSTPRERAQYKIYYITIVGMSR